MNEILDSRLLMFTIALRGKFEADYSCPISLSLFTLHTDTPASEQQVLFVQKLEQCCYIFDFDDPVIDMRSKEVKRACLNELIDFLTNNRGVLTEPVYQDVVKMVRLCRTMIFNLGRRFSSYFCFIRSVQ